ncbi:(2Fe-2S)-binding protein [Kutzneria kofuensis]|uniref:Nicotinate dehydrogenase subunit A n=1 Tax=Kutzneria kofuensis TaxID=103725 RepID=A0A7W9NEG7_9PSEU|nr:2Fe-2S iron-sulfur cluster-binding protein [Kutzneria kofuensis]MBB5890302.1 nicotinate dehydrogenase subunit A [Kutzneria kofuensis]
MSDETFRLLVNGAEVTVEADRDTPLLYALRNQLGLKGTRFGCGLGLCGSCNVVVDGRAVHSCDTPLWSVEGKEVVTVEGLGDTPLQRAMIDEQAAQCGYCVSGVVMTATALLARNSSPSETEVRQALDDNLCRCGAHNRMVRAVVKAARIEAARTEAAQTEAAR